MPGDSTQRFSNRVDYYVRSRPGYPPEVLQTLQEYAGLRPGAAVADLGSGTGISSELLLRAGCRVFAVEPNAAMREAAEARLNQFANFSSIDATAEHTGLPEASIDLVLAAQAFHWFDPPRVRAEFDRIVRPGGFVALVWNLRLIDTTPFLRDYEALLQEFGTDYQEVSHGQGDSGKVEDFFAPRPVTRKVFANSQLLDLPGLRDRLLSSSYAPAPGTSQHEPMLDRLGKIFAAHATAGVVELQYETSLSWARWTEPVAEATR